MSIRTLALGLYGEMRLGPRAFIRRWARANYDHLTLAPTIESIDLSDHFTDGGPLSVEFATGAWGLPPTETVALLRLARAISAKTVFEFGTYEGATTLALARALPEARITTIDLPFKRPEFTVGSRFEGLPEAARIEQIRADSTNYDFAHRSADLVFVDGSHSYPIVASDSRHALDIARFSGVVMWDDYTTWTGVHRAVNRIAQRRMVWHIKNTRLAFTTDI